MLCRRSQLATLLFLFLGASISLTQNAAQSTTSHSPNQQAAPSSSVVRLRLENANQRARLLLLEKLASNPSAFVGSKHKSNLDTLIGPKTILIPFSLTIDKIDPPSAWSNKAIDVTFTLRNRSALSTSGSFHATLTQNDINQLSSSQWFPASARVSDLGPGQSVTKSIRLENWTAVKLSPETADLTLEYWVEDPNGTLTMVHKGVLGSPQTATTYSMVGLGYSTEELYPTCQPDGPDFIAAHLAVANSILLIDPGTSLIKSGQPVTLQWVVPNGDFPAFGSHPGSFVTAVISGPSINENVADSGKATVDLVGMSPAAAMQPFKIVATGNCGEAQDSLQLQAVFPLPPQQFPGGVGGTTPAKCGAGPACEPGTVCQSGKCVSMTGAGGNSCARVGQSCVPDSQLGNHCCKLSGSSELCNFEICVTCIAHRAICPAYSKQICCNSDDQCVADPVDGVIRCDVPECGNDPNCPQPPK